jgi:hypothetical protein
VRRDDRSTGGPRRTTAASEAPRPRAIGSARWSSRGGDVQPRGEPTIVFGVVTYQVIHAIQTSGLYAPVNGRTLFAMADHSAIEWTESTWNPTSGCTRVSPGCDRCYAERMALRFPKTFPNGFDLTLRPDSLDMPLRWRRPRTIFVNSMSDLFHVEVPDV